MKNQEKKLNKKQHYILREKGTEPAFSGKLLYNKEKGEYSCIGCRNKIFSSNTKYNSDSGWPSFYDAKKGSVKLKKDLNHGMIRTEVTCKKCGGHLGHVFDDAPQTPTGKRYCINSLALEFKGLKKNEKATFGAGCFWHVEKEFNNLKGVIETTVGFMGGTVKNPLYNEVSSDKTGHAEVCQVFYNPKKISYEQLLKKFWEIHDPTQKDRQGPDTGTQYKSVIFYHNQKQKKEAIKSKEQEQKKYKKKIVTEIKPTKSFYKAEEYHQSYYKKCGI